MNIEQIITYYETCMCCSFTSPDVQNIVKHELTMFMAVLLNCNMSEVQKEIELIKTTFKK